MNNDSDTALFLIEPGDSTFRLFERTPTERGFKKIPLTLSTIYDRWVDFNDDHPLFDFFPPVMVVLSVEFHQRNVIKRILTKKSRNIRFKTESIYKYLSKALKELKKANTDKFEQIQSRLNDSLADIKKLLGMPVEAPFEYSYIMTDEVIAEADNDQACREYLSDEQTDEFLTYKQYKDLIKKVQKKFPDKANAISRALYKTQNKEHLSIFSIDVDDGVTYIHIVSPDKDQIRLESHKFIALVEEAGEALHLHKFEKRSYKDQPDKFIFNNNSKGTVEGLFHPQTSTLQVICYEKSRRNPDDNVAFILDNSYVVSLYIMLKKLKNDQTKFEMLKEKADTNIANKDVFESLFSRYTKLEEENE
eukprot:Anaeramoba_ignava/c16233_g1_i2.p1 GENE.c16233_g1_i2~~c16233_g1_i2.p1  ORF type:complete len:362 (+),score=12.94 c16233_g1_i2:108-1193(+)